MIVEGQLEIASSLFPYEPEEGEQRTKDGDRGSARQTDRRGAREIVRQEGPEMTSSFTADDGGRSIAIVRRMKKLREDLQDGEIGELTFLFEYGALERELAGC